MSRAASNERDPLTHQIIGAAIAVHDELGPGLLESAYEACLAFELAERGLKVKRQVSLPIKYKGMEVDAAYRIDLVVDGHVIVEIKAIAAVEPVHEAQLLSYLKLSRLRVGLIINFHSVRIRDGIKRMVL